MEDIEQTSNVIPGFKQTSERRGSGVSGEKDQVIRILAVCNTWNGANSDSYVRAFRRAGHVVQVIPPDDFFPRWKSLVLRGLRRLLKWKITGEFTSAIITSAKTAKPDMFFVFKGELVHPSVIQYMRHRNIICVNFWPDVSFFVHGPLAPLTLPYYDWIFTSKSYGVEDLRKHIGVEKASFLPHAYDPRVHSPVQIAHQDAVDFVCDISFIGNWSPKKEALLTAIALHNSHWVLKIWGSDYWKKAKGLKKQFQGYPVLGQEYARAICASRINICILSERRAGASSGDLTTARTFELAGAGGFMLHERTEEAMRYFEEGKECAFFDDAEDLVSKIRYYLAHEDERRAIAAAGRQRALTSGYSYDDRVGTVIAKYHELRSQE